MTVSWPWPRISALDATPLIIVQEMGLTDSASLALKEPRLWRLFGNWAGAMASGSYHEYLSFFSDAYLPEMTWWETWL